MRSTSHLQYAQGTLRPMRDHYAPSSTGAYYNSYSTLRRQPSNPTAGSHYGGGSMIYMSAPNHQSASNVSTRMSNQVFSDIFIIITNIAGSDGGSIAHEDEPLPSPPYNGRHQDNVPPNCLYKGIR